MSAAILPVLVQEELPDVTSGSRNPSKLATGYQGNQTALAEWMVLGGTHKSNLAIAKNTFSKNILSV